LSKKLRRRMTKYTAEAVVSSAVVSPSASDAVSSKVVASDSSSSLSCLIFVRS